MSMQNPVNILRDGQIDVTETMTDTDVAPQWGGTAPRGGKTVLGRILKDAALSISPVLEVYSWQERNAIYSMTLDVEDVGSNKSNLIELADPTLNEKLPSEIVEIFSKPMVFPRNPLETQTLFARNSEEL